jgi:hypothetical protein
MSSRLLVLLVKPNRESPLAWLYALEDSTLPKLLVLLLSGLLRRLRERRCLFLREQTSCKCAFTRRNLGVSALLDVAYIFTYALVCVNC